MTAFVALFRAINVGGQGKVSMADLRETATASGLEEPKTVLQTGNLVFRADAAPSAIEAALEASVGERVGLRTDIMVRSVAEWARLMAENPFAEEAEKDPAHLVLMTLKSAPGEREARALQASIKGRERISIRGRAAYLVYPDGIGVSKLTPAVLERHLATRGTCRNWNTVTKIAALLTA